MEMKRLIICMVGTSLLDLDKKILSDLDLNKLRIELKGMRGVPSAQEFMKDRVFSGFYTNTIKSLAERWCYYQTLLSENCQINAKLESARKQLPAEICSLNALGIQPLDVVVLIYSDSPEGAFAAICLQSLINSKRIACCEKIDVAATVSQLTDFGGIRMVDGLNARQPYDFAERGISNLVNIILELREAVKDKQIIIDVTGGFKPQTIYSALVGLLSDFKVFFLHQEFAGEGIGLQQLPVHFDLLSWHEHETELSLLPTLSQKQTKEYYDRLPLVLRQCLELKDQCHEVDHAKDTHYCWKPLGRALRQRYREEYRIERYTSGQQLLSLVTESALREKLLERIAKRHPYFWEGDKLPEAVGHGRKHTQNLLNLAAQVLPYLGKDNVLSPYEVYLLINCLWFHDIGQAGGKLYLRRNGDKWILKDDTDSEAVPLYLTNPHMVREAHNLLTYERIRNNCKALGFQNFDKEAELIAEICRYNRKSMPLIEEHPPFKCNFYGYNLEIKNPLRDKADDLSIKIRPRLVCALLRVIDSCDTQQLRTGDDAFKELRKFVTEQDREAAEKRMKELEPVVIALAEAQGSKLDLTNKSWQSYLDNFRMEDIELNSQQQALLNALIAYQDAKDTYEFRGKQEQHFLKHDQIERVFISFDEKTDGLYFFEINMQSIPDADKNLLNQAYEDILKDYEAAKTVLKKACIAFKVEMKST